MLRLAATSPLTIAVPSRTVAAESETKLFEEITKDFFSKLRSKDDKQNAIVSCANQFCEERKAISEETLTAIEETGELAHDSIRRARFGVRLLVEYGLTDVLEESMLKPKEQDVRKFTRYLPLLGSFNNCLNAACAVDENKPETIERFLIAVVAFGLEVALWYVGAPFRMAWRGTRFIANRTFLRLAKHGCRACVAFAMSELHWAIRGTAYNLDEIATEKEYVLKKLSKLYEFAEEIDYPVDIYMSENEVEVYLDDASERVGGAPAPVVQKRNGFIDRLLPDIKIDFDIKDILDRIF